MVTQLPAGAYGMEGPLRGGVRLTWVQISALSLVSEAAGNPFLSLCLSFIYFNLYGNSAYLLFRNILMLLGQNPGWLMSQRERNKSKKLL